MLSCFNFLKKKEKYISIVSEKYSNFNLENIEGKFYVESVYDGDTITILVPTKLSIYNMGSENTVDLNSNTNQAEKIVLNKIRVRLYGIDTPELKPKKNLTDRDEHIAKAKEARDFLSQLILNKIIKISFLSNDKYGRPLVKLYSKEITADEICLNDLMIKKGFAKKYDGGTKDSDF
jgi:endonuclease YncB( thermonuclease family)